MRRTFGGKSNSNCCGFYHRALLAGGVANYSFDQCVADYRLAVFICPFVPIAWNRPKFVSYALTAFRDWDCEDLLG
mgnify:CR=1 FL=1